MEKEILDKLISIDGVRAITILVFLIIISLTALKFYSSKDRNNEAGLQKIIGGLSVFIVALISQNAYVFIMSLFIGGLIIASEKFMKIFAAIMKSDPQNIAKIIRYDLAPATDQDVEKKEQEEKKEIETIAEREKQTPIREKGAILTALEQDKEKEERLKGFRMDLKKTREIEEKVIDLYKKSMGDWFKSNIKIKNEFGGYFLADGIISFPNNDTALPRVIEIKYLPHTYDGKFFVNITAQRIIGKIRSVLPNAPITLILVFNDIDLNSAKKLVDELKTTYGIETQILLYQENEIKIPDLLKV